MGLHKTHMYSMSTQSTLLDTYVSLRERSTGGFGQIALARLAPCADTPTRVTLLPTSEALVALVSAARL